MEIKDKIKELRLEKGLTQSQLAKEINFSLSIVSKWENDKKTPSIPAVIILAKYFNVTSDYLLGLEE